MVDNSHASRVIIIITTITGCVKHMVWYVCGHALIRQLFHEVGKTPSIAGSYSALVLILLPRTHAQGVKQLVLSVVVVMKIGRSRVLGICACCNYHKLVDIGEKLVSVCFRSLNMAH